MLRKRSSSSLWVGTVSKGRPSNRLKATRRKSIPRSANTHSRFGSSQLNSTFNCSNSCTHGQGYFMGSDLLNLLASMNSDLNPYLFIFVERRLIVMPVVKLGGARGGVGGHRLRVFQGAVAFQVIGDASCSHRMIADAGFDACLACAPLNHPVAVLLCHAVRPARVTSGQGSDQIGVKICSK